MNRPIEWTKLRSGVWNGIRCGRVVGTIVRHDKEPRPAYVGRVGLVTVRAGSADDVKELLADE